MGSDPQVYAESILKICELYLESPLPWVSGATGANLRKRIESIMANRIAVKLGPTKKAVLAAAGMAVLALPIVVGMMNTADFHAQTPSVSNPFRTAAVVRRRLH
jgi:hypothetical protein